MPLDLWACAYVAAQKLIEDAQLHGVPAGTHNDEHQAWAVLIYEQVRKAHEVSKLHDDRRDTA